MLDLNNSKTLEAIRYHAEEAVNFDLADKARLLAGFLEDSLTKGIDQPEAELACEEMLVKARFVALPRLAPGEIIELIKNNLSAVTAMPGYNLWEKVKAKLLSLPEFEERNTLRKLIREALLVSDQDWTEEKIIINGREMRGTVKNWLTDYRSVLGTGRVETLKLSQYLTSGENAKKLSREGRARLDYLFKFYEKMKLSSLELDGIEETTVFVVDGEVDIYEEGITERVGRDVKDMVKQAQGVSKVGEIQDEIEAKYRGDAAEAKKIETEMKNIAKESGGESGKLEEILFEAIPGPGRTVNKYRLSAVLMVMAEGGKLAGLLEEKKFNEMMVVHLKEGSGKAELAGFKLSPKDPRYLSLFLQYVLKERARLSEDESGRIGMKLFNILSRDGAGGKYQGLVYFDLEKQEFKWS